MKTVNLTIINKQYVNKQYDVINAVRRAAAAAVLAALAFLACSSDGPGLIDPSSRSVVYDTLTDARDGAVYRAVRIGNRTWMAENINHQISGSSWCYDNDTSNCAVYGRLYSWDAAVSVCSGLGGGWRLPARADWDDLVSAAGGGAAGGRLKTYRGWSGGGGTDYFGFSAMPGGNRVLNNFSDAGSHGYWWSVTEEASGNAYYRSMDHGAGVVELDGGKSRGFSVRCVKN